MPDSGTKAGGNKADWIYRAVLGAGMAYGMNWIGGKVETLSGLPSQVRQIATDQTQLKASVEDVKKAQEEIKQAQADYATGEQVGDLEGRLDTLTGRVDTLETTVNSVFGKMKK